MKKKPGFHFWIIAGTCLASLPAISHADDHIAKANLNLHKWQLKRLYNPTPSDVEQETKGNVYIYDGMTDVEVEAAINMHFDRIQNMMFIGTIKTGPGGQPKIDPETGKVAVESNGCAN